MNYFIVFSIRGLISFLQEIEGVLREKMQMEIKLKVLEEKQMQRREMGHQFKQAALDMFACAQSSINFLTRYNLLVQSNKALIEKIGEQEKQEERREKEIRKKEKEINRLKSQSGAHVQPLQKTEDGSDEDLRKRIAVLEKENEDTLVRLGSQLASLHVEKNKLAAQLATKASEGSSVSTGELSQLKDENARLAAENKSLSEKMEEIRKDKEDVVTKLADQFSMLQDQIAIGMSITVNIFYLF